METNPTNEEVCNAVGKLRMTTQVCSPPYSQGPCETREQI